MTWLQVTTGENILDDEEMYGEERINNEMETTQRKDTAGEDRENEGHITQAGVNSWWYGFSQGWCYRAKSKA